MNARYVLVVEDDVLLRELIASALETHGYQVQTAGTVADAKRIFKLSDPDGVVLDVDLGPGPTGFDLGAIIQAESPGTGIVFLTNLPDPRFAESTLSTSIKNVAYLRKTALADLNLLLEALDLCMRGEVLPLHRQDLAEDRPLAKLTKKQIAVLQYMAEGKSNAQIAEARGTSLKATEDAIRRACEALGIDQTTDGNTRTAAVAKYLAVVGTNYISKS
jgi:DNA-binding NarL/FixJ family response regulator